MAKVNQSSDMSKPTGEIISMVTISIDNTDQRAASARELHTFLGIETRFNDWFDRMKDYGFTEGVDYTEVLLKNEYNPKGGRPSTDYALTLDMAKEVSMIQRTAKGKEARQYFLKVEKQWLSGGTNAELKILPPNLPMVDIEVMGKNVSAIEHPEFGHLFTKQAVARFSGFSEDSVSHRRIGYKPEEGTDFYFFYTKNKVGLAKTAYFTRRGLEKSQFGKSLVRAWGQNRVHPNNIQTSLFTPQAPSLTDSPLDLLMRIEDAEVRLGLFAHFKNGGF